MRKVNSVLLFALLILLNFNFSFSQDSTFVRKYIYRSKVKLGTSLFTQTLDIYNSDINSLDSHSVFVPNVNSTFNISLGLRWFSIGYSFKIPDNYFSEEKFGKTKYRNFSFDSYHKWWGASAYLRTYEGFFQPGKFYKTAEMRPDVSFINTGINLFYFGNSNKFSFRAAFSQDRKQLKSAGGFILGGELSYKRFEGDRSLIIPEMDKEIHFAAFKGLRFIGFGLLELRPGYAYNFILKQGRYYICPMLLLGGGASIYHYKTEILNDYTIALHGDGEFRISAGHDADQYFINCAFGSLANMNFLSKTARFTHTTYNVSLTFGYRFDRKKN